MKNKRIRIALTAIVAALFASAFAACNVYEKEEVEELVENKIKISYELHGSSIENLQKAVGMPEEPADNIVKKFISAN